MSFSLKNMFEVVVLRLVGQTFGSGPLVHFKVLVPLNQAQNIVQYMQ